MASRSSLSLALPRPLVRRVRRLAHKEARAVPDVLSRALAAYQDQQEERVLLQSLRAAARRRGIRSQRDVVRIVDELREPR